MDEITSALVSVRGEARVIVPPDFATLSGVVSATRDAKAEALRAASSALTRLTDELTSLGGVPLTVDAERAPLAWSAYSAGTELEHAHDERTGRYAATGRVTASVSVTVTVRAFDLLDRLGDTLANHDQFNVHSAVWEVDPDNPAWPQARAAAIRDAISKGHHYAEALGGSLDHVEHIADAGLLNGGEGEFVRRSPARYAALSAAAEPNSPSLDPVPQELVATIDARFVANVAAL